MRLEDVTKSATIFEQPRRMWFATDYGWPQSYEVIGETSRSWLWGRKWDVSRIAKKEYREITEQEYERRVWVRNHRDHIARTVRDDRTLSYEILRQIAELIGYGGEGK